jgi:hypothetical protein
MAWSNSATHDAATSAFKDLELAEDILERICDEASGGAALRGKWEGIGNAMDYAYRVRPAAELQQLRPRGPLTT